MRMRSIAVVAALFVGGCGVGPAGEGEAGFDEGEAPEDFEAPLDEKGDAPRSTVARFGAARTSQGWTATAYSSAGSAVSRLAVTRSGGGWRALFVGNGTSVTLDFTAAATKGGDVTVRGTYAGRPFTIAGSTRDPNAVKRTGGPALSSKQAALVAFWGANAPQVMAKASLGDCALAVAEAIGHIAGCAAGSFWSCVRAVGAVAGAIGTCREALH